MKKARESAFYTFMISSVTSTAMQQTAATKGRLRPLHEQYTPAARAISPDTGVPVDVMIAGKVMTARVA